MNIKIQDNIKMFNIQQLLGFGLRFILFTFFFLIVSCTPDDVAGELPKRLVFVYMIADNDLDYFALKDLNEMEAGFPKNTNDKLVVYVDMSKNSHPSYPCLLEITHDTSNKIVSPVFFKFPEQNSADTKVFQKALKKVFDYYKNENFTSKGVVFWSHGDGWLPQGTYIPKNKDDSSGVVTKSFGIDFVPKASSIDIKELAKALENNYFDFLLFDACLMSSIEVLYQFRNTADYIIASPTDISSFGFPYQYVVPLFFEEKLNVGKIAKTYFDYYNKKSGPLRSASIAAIKMDEIENLTQQIYQFNTAFASLSDKKNSTEHLQQLDRFDGKWVFDLKDFLQKTAKKYQLESKYNSILDQWRKTIIYHNHTPLLRKNIDLKNCNGISTYLPNSNHKKEIKEYYKTLDWYTASGFNQTWNGF